MKFSLLASEQVSVGSCLTPSWKKNKLGKMAVGGLRRSVLTPGRRVGEQDVSGSLAVV